MMKKSENTTRPLVKLLILSAAVVITVLGSGCFAVLLGAGAGVAGTAYYEGKLTSTVKANPEQVQTATEAAFKEQNIKLTSSTSNTLEAKIVGKTAEDSTVTVTASLEKNGQSKVGIRIGTFGNQAMSEKIYAAIDRNLPKAKK
ncbi:MAG: DUF3568 family protein [Victivallaceae bacterium]|nr:DUF3568 family protein [Victivallaceae bacterium]